MRTPSRLPLEARASTAKPTRSLLGRQAVRRLAVAVAFLAVLQVHAAGPLDEADTLLGAGRFEDAVKLLEPMVEANPFNGEQAYYLGAALARAGRCDEALPHLDRALELGMDGERHGLRSAHLRAAECAARRGEHAEAVHRLRRAWTRHWANGLDVNQLPEDELYDPARKLGLFDPLTGRSPEADAGDREAQQRAELAYFDRLIRETHPGPFHTVSEEEWRKSVEALDRRIPLKSPHFTLGLMRLAASIYDGHTAVFPKIAGDGAWRLLPIYVRWFTDGWVISAAAPEHEAIVGARIDGVAGKPLREIIDFARAVSSRENEMAIHWLGGVFLSTYEIYEAAGVASGGEVVLDLTLPTGEPHTARLPAGPFNRHPGGRDAPAGWPAIGRDALWLRSPATLYATHWFEEQKALYVQLNQMRNGARQTLAEFAQSVFEELTERSARSILLELRHNNGGETDLVFPFLRAIDRYAPLQEDGAIIALIGPRSFSATMAMAGRLERDMNALFVGGPTGGRPSVWGTERPFALPYSGITGTIPVMWHRDGMSGNDIRPWIPPDIAVWPSRADILAGRDPVLEQALELAAKLGGSGSEAPGI